MSEAFFHTDCPSCGAPVDVMSATAQTVVCTYCQSMLVIHDQTLRDSGRDSALIQDFSPIQVGTQGRFANQQFAVLGRIQAQYDEGVWNEWYVRFDDGGEGWLSEAGDLHVLVKQVHDLANVPEFENIVAGESVLDYGRRFVAADVREIILRNAAAQGELPFRLPESMVNRVADWRSENLFLTLDYAEQTPLAYIGKTVTLTELALQNTRDEQQIRAQTGKIKGQRHSENCPNCGASLHWPLGAATHLVCASCGSELAVKDDKAQLLAANTMRQAQQAALPLPLGKQGKINNTLYTVIGVIRQEEISMEAAFNALSGRIATAVPQGWWREYLLYSPQKGFLWLVETPEDGWSLSETLATWPRLTPTLAPQGAPQLYAYGGRVSFAAGAFYWHVRANDVTFYQDYQQGQTKLSAARTTAEWSWSKNTPVPYARIQEWFKLTTNAPQYQTTMRPDRPTRGLSLLLMAVYVILNLPAWIMMDSDNYITSLIVSGCVLAFLYQNAEEDE